MALQRSCLPPAAGTGAVSRLPDLSKGKSKSRLTVYLPLASAPDSVVFAVIWGLPGLLVRGAALARLWMVAMPPQAPARRTYSS